MKLKTYSEMMQYSTYEDRLNYLKIYDNKVGEDKFGALRYFNQKFYQSPEWRQLRNKIIARDYGCDLGIDGSMIRGKIIIHHLNPISIEDIENSNDILWDPENLISVSHETHNAIHYGSQSEHHTNFVERKANDTCPWK